MSFIDFFLSKKHKENRKAQMLFREGYDKSQGGYNKEAIELYSQLIEFYPHTELANVYFNRGNVKSKLGLRIDAIEDFNIAINLSKENPQYDYFYNRGNQKLQLGDLTDALNDLTQASLISPKKAVIYLKRAQIYEALNDIENATHDYVTASNINPNSLPANECIRWADMLFLKGELQKSLAFYTLALLRESNLETINKINEVSKLLGMK